MVSALHASIALWLWVALGQEQSQRVIKSHRCWRGKLPASEAVRGKDCSAAAEWKSWEIWGEKQHFTQFHICKASCISVHLQHQVSDCPATRFSFVWLRHVAPCDEYLINLWQHEWLFTPADLIHVSRMLHLSKVRTFQCYHPHKHSTSASHLCTCPLMLSP